MSLSCIHKVRDKWKLREEKGQQILLLAYILFGVILLFRQLDNIERLVSICCLTENIEHSFGYYSTRLVDILSNSIAGIFLDIG